MAVDKLVDSAQLDSDLTSVANAIRAKSGGSSQLAFPAGFVSEIQAIPSGGGAVISATGTFTMAADGTPPILTHNLGTQKIAVVIYPISKVTASGGYKNFYCEYINTAAFFEGDTWTFDWTSYNSKFSGDETVTFPNNNLRVGAIHASPWTTQSNWYDAGNPPYLNPVATRIAITDDTVRIKGPVGNFFQWASGTYRWIVWKLG